MEWVDRNGISTSKVSADDLPELVAWLNERPIFIDRRFAVTEDPIHAKSQFCQTLVNHRPALKILYDGVLEQNKSSSEFAWRSTELNKTLREKDPGDISMILEMKRHARGYIDASGASEDLAGALLLTLDEIVESLIIELTGDRSKFLGLGSVINGVAIGDAVKACGNYVRHKSEWALYMSRRQLLESHQETSIRYLARLISHDHSVDDSILIRRFFGHTDHMRESLFEIAGLYQYPEQEYAHLEELLIDLGSTIIDYYWENRKKWQPAK
jgi:hypothetical protein